MSEQTSYEGWAIVELLGHHRTAGRIQGATLAGAQMLRLDVPGDGEAFDPPQFIAPAALYRVTVCTEAQARKEVAWMRPRPFVVLPAASDGDEQREDEEGDGRDDIPFDPKPEGAAPVGGGS